MGYGFDQDFTAGMSWSSTDGGDYKLRERDRVTDEPTTIPLSPPMKMVLDLGTAGRGWVRFKPFDLRTAPVSDSLPDEPHDIGLDGKPAYSRLFDLQMILEVGGLRSWLASGALLTRYLGALLEDLANAVEARNGNIPFLNWTGSLPRTLRSGPGAGRTYYVPALEVCGWTARPNILGPRTVPVLTAATSALTASVNFAPTASLPAPDPAVRARSRRNATAAEPLDDAIPF